MKRLALAVSVVVLGCLAVSPAANAQGQILYVAEGQGASGGHLFKVDPTNTSSNTDIGPILDGSTGVPITGLAFHPMTGVLYAVSTNQGPTARNLYTINTSTAAATLIGSVGSRPIGDISFDQTGVLFGWAKAPPSSRGSLGRKHFGAGSTDGLVTIDLGTGAATAVGPPTYSGSSGSGLAFALGTLYLSVEGTSGPLRTVNPATGALTVGPTMDGTGNDIPAMSADPAGNLWGIDGGDRIMKINPSTGAITNPGFLPSDSIDAMAFQNSAVGGLAPIDIPALGRFGLLALVGMLAVAGLLIARIRP